MTATLMAFGVVACGSPDHPPSLDDRSAGLDIDGARSAHLTGSATTPGDRSREGKLSIATRSAAPSFLGSVHAVARDADGNVVAGADEDEGHGDSITARGELVLALPAADGYSIELDARTTEPRPSECHAAVAPLAVESDENARLQVLSWRCGEKVGFVPPTVDSQCYWLADWMSVARSVAGAGESVAIQVQPALDLVTPAVVRWSVEPPSAGYFEDSAASATRFACGKAGTTAVLSVTVTANDCVERLTQALACAR